MTILNKYSIKKKSYNFLYNKIYTIFVYINNINVYT